MADTMHTMDLTIARLQRRVLELEEIVEGGFKEYQLALDTLQVIAAERDALLAACREVETLALRGLDAMDYAAEASMIISRVLDIDGGKD